MSTMSNLSAIRTKVRKITARPSPNQLSDADIDNYINTFYLNDMPEHLRLESLLYNYQFLCSANVPVYDFPRNSYLTASPPVFIAGYQSYMTQSRQNFFRINPELNFLQQSVSTGNGTTGPYTGTLINLPMLPGFKPNPPGAYSRYTLSPVVTDIPAQFLEWNVLFSALGSPNGTSGISPSVSLVDDGQGNLFDPSDTSTNPSLARGTINYVTGQFTLNNFISAIPSGNAINCQYVPYVASRPQSVVFYQDQIILYPIPDQAYTISFECYKYPTELINNTDDPQLQEWWQLLAYGASDKIFADNADFENLQKFRPLLQEQMNLVQRRTIVQYTSERVSTIYTEQTEGSRQFPFGNLFGGF